MSSESPAIISTHSATVHHVRTEVVPDAVQRIGDIFREPRDRGSLIDIAANGGSSAIASDWVNDLGKAATRSGCPPFDDVLSVICQAITQAITRSLIADRPDPN
jgi:hypothetical protein